MDSVYVSCFELEVRHCCSPMNVWIQESPGDQNLPLSAAGHPGLEVPASAQPPADTACLLEGCC